MRSNLSPFYLADNARPESLVQQRNRFLRRSTPSRSTGPSHIAAASPVKTLFGSFLY